VGVQEDVLSLVVEQAGYGYKIVKQLGDEYSPAAVYKALGKLHELALIEPVEGLRDTTRPKKWYRATLRGANAHWDRVARALRDKLQSAEPDSVAAVIDEINEYELRVLEELRQNAVPQEGLIENLIATERRLVNQARLRWIAYAREAMNGSSGA